RSLRAAAAAIRTLAFAALRAIDTRLGSMVLGSLQRGAVERRVRLRSGAAPFCRNALESPAMVVPFLAGVAADPAFYLFYQPVVHRSAVQYLQTARHQVSAARDRHGKSGAADRP